jgi:hypothetical protein
MLKKLPIGIQTFSKIVEGDYLYIDKTKLALNLIENNQYTFLSRPRRFGKSLFLDTLQEIFKGNRELFKGLHIYDKYDFESYPVIKIDWRRSMQTLDELHSVAYDILKENQDNLGIKCSKQTDIGSCFEELIREAYKKYNKPVVILVDEYDKPILDVIDNKEQANINRNFLRGIYSILKSSDRYIKFAFLTGVTKFSKASIFSGLNNIEDISLTPKFGDICGYTQNNIENEFKEYLVDADLEKVKLWYNGYNFMGERVYNPFDILKFIKSDFIFDNYWWESGNSFALIELLKKGNYFLPNLQNVKTNKTLLNSFDIEKLQLESLLFQAGYLTIDRVNIEDEFDIIEYYLKVPNKEVQISLNRLILKYLLNSDIFNNKELLVSLRDAKLKEFENILISLFSSIANDNYRRNDIAHFEGYYASVIYSYLAGSGMQIVAEDVTNRGKIDLTLKIQEKIYILEFKVGTSNALQQIKEKNYQQKYLNEGKDIYLIGINFNEKSKNISGFEWERVEI